MEVIRTVRVGAHSAMRADGSTQRRDASGSLVIVYNYLIREHREDENRLFSQWNSNRSRVNRHNVQCGKFQSDIRKI